MLKTGCYTEESLRSDSCGVKFDVSKCLVFRDWVCVCVRRDRENGCVRFLPRSVMLKDDAYSLDPDQMFLCFRQLMNVDVDAN